MFGEEIYNDILKSTKNYGYTIGSPVQKISASTLYNNQPINKVELGKEIMVKMKVMGMWINEQGDIGYSLNYTNYKGNNKAIYIWERDLLNLTNQE